MKKTSLRMTALRTDGRVDPIGIDDAMPRLSWHLEGDVADAYTGYQVQVGARPTFRDPLWDTGRIDDPAAGVRFAGPAPRSRERRYWRARAFSGERAGAWSAPAAFETGLIEADDWTAEWIGVADDAVGRPLIVSTTVTVPADAVRTRLFVSALGWMRVFVDDVDLTEGTLVPRFTPYDSEVEYSAFALDDLTPGPHRVAIVVGDGRFRGALGLHSRRSVYGARLGTIAQFETETAAGTRLRTGTDTTWSGGHGARVHADPKAGETIDLTAAVDGASHRPSSHARVVRLAPHARALVAEQADPVREIATLAPVDIVRSGERTVVDFGQNVGGVVRVRLRGRRGQRITIQHAEDLTDDGAPEFWHLDRSSAAQDPRDRRFQRDEIVLDGRSAPEWVQPWFTIHGFRYAEITGLTEPIAEGDIRAVVLSSTPGELDGFSSSDARLDRLYRNVVWSMRGNFTDTATDCPTRERGGFTGDAQIFAPAATGLADVERFFARYLRSLRLDQLEDGRVPMVIPRESSPFSGKGPTVTRLAASSVGWGDAATLIPWTLYEAYGDTRILADQFDSMRAWVDFLVRTGARRGFIWGEWIRAGDSVIRGAMRDNSLNRKNIGYAYLAASARIVADSAALLGRVGDGARYAAVADEALHTWRRVAVRRGGARIGTDRQDDYVRALALRLLPTDQAAAAAARLAELIERADAHLGTGFLSTALLLPALHEHGHTALAHRLLQQTTAPSWLAMIERGATTVWENWQEPGRDGARVGSSNHYAFGSVALWLQSGVVGLTSLAPGRRRLRFAPIPGGALTHAATVLPTPYGPVRAGWSIAGDALTARMSLPIGVTADVLGPAGTLRVGAGDHELTWRTDTEGSRS